jgi:hypothetical protein
LRIFHSDQGRPQRPECRGCSQAHELAALGQLTPVHIPARALREHRGLVKYRKTIVGRLNRVQNILRPLFPQHGLALPVGARCGTCAGPEAIAAQSKSLAERGREELWRGQLAQELAAYHQLQRELAELEKKLTALAEQDERVTLLQTMPGVGRPSYVTCHGETDTPGGWRERKACGGSLIDVATGKKVAGAWRYPTCPAGPLWLLESGAGRLCRVDQGTGRVEPVVELPGFTRGLDFCGPYAFVGLAQVRETAIFSSIPIIQRLQKAAAACGYPTSALARRLPCCASKVRFRRSSRSRSFPASAFSRSLPTTRLSWVTPLSFRTMPSPKSRADPARESPWRDGRAPRLW